MLVVEKPPVCSEERIQDTHATIEWQFGNLGGFEFTISIAVLDHKVIVLGIDNVREDAVVTSFLDSVVDGCSGIEMDGLGKDDAGGFLVDFGVQDELANVGLVAITLLDEFIAADAESLYPMHVSMRQMRVCDTTHVSGNIGIRYSNEISVLPLEYHKTSCRIFDARIATVEELDKNEWVNGSAP
jgi:hypothetical protein